VTGPFHVFPFVILWNEMNWVSSAPRNLMQSKWQLADSYVTELLLVISDSEDRKEHEYLGVCLSI
jgi:hypothetical protein